MFQYIGYLKLSPDLVDIPDFDQWIKRLTYPWARKQDIEDLGIQRQKDGTEKYVIAFRDSGRMEVDPFAHGIALQLLDLVKNYNIPGEGSLIYGLENYDLDTLDRNTNMIYRFDNYGKAKVNYTFPYNGKVRYHKITEDRGRDEPFTEIEPPTDLKRSIQGKGESLIRTHPY